MKRKGKGRNTVPLTIAITPEERDAIYEMAAQMELSNVSLVLTAMLKLFQGLGTGESFALIPFARDTNIWKNIKAHVKERVAEERAVSEQGVLRKTGTTGALGDREVSPKAGPGPPGQRRVGS